MSLLRQILNLLESSRFLLGGKELIWTYGRQPKNLMKAFEKEKCKNTPGVTFTFRVVIKNSLFFLF